MAKLILTLDTKTGHIDYDYPEGTCVPPIIVNGSFEGYMKGAGENAEHVITGWTLSVRVGELPEERERQRHVGRLLTWRDRQKEALRSEVDDDGVSTLDISLRSRLEGAVELAEALLEEMGYVEGPCETEKEPSDGEGQEP